MYVFITDQVDADAACLGGQVHDTTIFDKVVNYAVASLAGDRLRLPVMIHLFVIDRKNTRHG